MTAIEWTHRPGTVGESWNLIGGCTKVSPACDNCWALSMSWRLQNNPKRPDRYEGVVGPHGTENDVEWTGRVNLDYDALEKPYRWKKPRTVFVASMSDLFHPQVPDEFIYRVLDVIDSCPQHTFLILTKRPDRMLTTMNLWYEDSDLPTDIPENLWLGITAENQEQADLRIPLLLHTPAAVRWVSVEPMLEPIKLWRGLDQPISDYQMLIDVCDWIVIGCESGPNRRPFDNIDAMRLAFQCDDARVSVFVKQIHDVDGKVSKDPSEWPAELQRREWPK